MKRYVTWEALLAVVLVALIGVGAAASDVFFERSNFTLIVAHTMEKAVMALPMALIIISGEIDLSVASTLGLSSAMVGVTWDMSWPFWICVLCALITGIACGVLNGLLITRLGLPSLVVTLGTLALYRGLASVLLGDSAISNFPRRFTTFGFGTIGNTGIPWTLLIFLPLLCLFALVLHRSWIGRQIYAAGNNPVAARFSAVRVARVKFWLFVASGLLAAVAGIMFTARVSSSRSDNAIGFELDVIAAVLLGGVSIFGGRGTLLGVVLALAVIATMSNILALTTAQAEIQSIAVGSLLVLSVLGPNLFRRLRGVPIRKSLVGMRFAPPAARG